MSTTDNDERIRVVHVDTADHQCRKPAPRIDQIPVLLAGLGFRTQSEHSVFAVDDHFPSCGNVARYQRRNADAEVDITSVRQVLRSPPGHLLARERTHVAPPGTKTRSTKMPGVTTASGSSAPSSTNCVTSATVSSAAIANTGLKLRADLRYVRLPQRSA